MGCRPAFSVAMYCFVPSLRNAEFCGVPSRATVTLGSAMGKRRLRNTPSVPTHSFVQTVRVLLYLYLISVSYVNNYPV
jgi:hypothetical protein